MAQKVLQIGSSAGITISPEGLKTLKVKVGDTIEVSLSEKFGVMVIKSTNSKSPVNLDLLAWTEEMISQYGPALKALAKK